MDTHSANLIDFAAFRAARERRETAREPRLDTNQPERALTHREVEHRRQMLAHLAARPLPIRALS